MERVGVRWAPVQQEAIAALRFIQPAGLVVQLRVAQTGRLINCLSRLFAVQFFFAATLFTVHANTLQ